MNGRVPGNTAAARLLARVIVVFLLMAFAAPLPRCGGEIYFYRLGKRVFYDQSSDSQPTTPSFMDAGVDLYASDPADLAAARVFSTTPALLSPASPFVLTEYSPGGWISSQAYASVEAMDINIPPGDVFGFLIEGGNLGSRLALASVPETNLFASDIPYFVGNSYTQLNGLDPTQPFNFAWNNFLAAPGVNDAPIFFNVFRVSDGHSLISLVLPTTTTTFGMPANTLMPGTQYAAQLDFSSRKNAFDAGFINADASALFDLVTTLYFTTGSGAGASLGTIPEPTTAALAGLAILAIGALCRSKRRRYAVATLIAAVVATGAPSADAAVHFYRVGKTIVHQQTSNSQPTTPVFVYGGVDLATSIPSDIGSARVFSTTTSPPSPVPEFILTEFFPGYWGSSQGYSSLVEMDTSLPPGDTFGFLIEGGDLGDQLALLSLPPTDLFASSVPFFTGSAFSQLNGLDPTQGFTLNWNTFVPAVGIDQAPLYFNIYRVSDGQNMIGASLPLSATSYEIPANTLAPNTAYKASLNFSSRNNAYDAGFGDADATALFDSVTDLHFTTGSQYRGDYNRDGSVDAADYVRWRKTLGQTNLPPYSGADGDGDGSILPPDYGIWRANFGETATGGASFAMAIPEPSGVALAFWAMAPLARRNRRSRAV